MTNETSPCLFLNTPYFVKLKKGPFPVQERPLDLPIYKS